MEHGPLCSGVPLDEAELGVQRILTPDTSRRMDISYFSVSSWISMSLWKGRNKSNGKKLDNAFRKGPVWVSLELIRTQEAGKTNSLSKDGAWMSHRRPPGGEARVRAPRGQAGRLRAGPGMAPGAQQRPRPWAPQCSHCTGASDLGWHEGASAIKYASH